MLVLRRNCKITITIRITFNTVVPGSTARGQVGSLMLPSKKLTLIFGVSRPRLPAVLPESVFEEPLVFPVSIAVSMEVICAPN